MKKIISTLGETLTKEKQLSINGGGPRQCYSDSDCRSGRVCCFVIRYRTDTCVTSREYCY
ncbi:hypothetical protein [Tenacibaculum sp. 190524A02b]|uniref:WAP-type (Whey Acidic protein) with four-disulfide core n=1 Tax=Tenacibaculum vairaonense TaxID=3137860 RepID=A0ABP1FAP2_9FLAO